MKYKGTMSGEFMNRAQAQRLFDENAVLIGFEDVVNGKAAEKLLGTDAINYATENAYYRNKLKAHFLNYSVSGTQDWKPMIECFLRFDAFFYAVTFNNMRLLQEQRKESKKK